MTTDDLPFDPPLPDFVPGAERPFPARLQRVPWQVSGLIVPLDSASPGDIVGMTAVYTAAFERRSDLQRLVDGFYVMGEEDLYLAFYDELPLERVRDRGARIALEHVFAQNSIDDDVLENKIVSETLNYQIFAVTFADMRCLFDTRIFHDPDYLWEDLEGHPDVSPCVIEVSGNGSNPEARVRAARYLEIIRKFLLENTPPPGFCEPNF